MGQYASLQSSAFTLDSYVKTTSFWYTFPEDDASGNQIKVSLKKTSESTWTTLALITSTTAVPWTQGVVSLAPTWQGATVEMRVSVTLGSGPVGFDQVGSLAGVELHWNTGVVDTGYGNQACIGAAGRHTDVYGTNNAYDLFADGNGGGCGGVPSAPVHLRTVGLAGSEYTSLTVEFDVLSNETCHWVTGRAYDAFSGAERGRYRWMHVAGTPEWGDILAGNNATTLLALGNTTDDTGCSGWVGQHVHQSVQSIDSETEYEVNQALTPNQLVDEYGWDHWMQRWTYNQ